MAGPCPIPFQPRQLLGQHTCGRRNAREKSPEPRTPFPTERTSGKPGAAKGHIRAEDDVKSDMPGMTEHQTAINFSRGMDAQGALTIWREGGGTIKLWTIHRSRLEVLLDDPWPTHQPWNSAALAGVCSSSGVESRNPLVDK